MDARDIVDGKVKLDHDDFTPENTLTICIGGAKFFTLAGCVAHALAIRDLLPMDFSGRRNFTVINFQSSMFAAHAITVEYKKAMELAAFLNGNYDNQECFVVNLDTLEVKLCEPELVS